MSISANEALSRIKVTAGTRPASDGRRLRVARRAMQWGALALAVLIPLTGLFRIDPAAATFVVLDRQIWFADFFIVAGFWLALSSILVMTYSMVGAAFCGWVCPQNTFSEWANRVTKRLLGKHAEVSLSGESLHVSAGKKSWFNWLLLGLLLSGAAMLLALIPLLYFYPPTALWSFITFRHDARLAPSLHWIYTVFVLIILVDIAVVRHFFCRFMCIYRVWQHSFKTTHTLHIAYDDARTARCAACNYCLTVCPVEIDPRNTRLYDSCINCGACISACDSLQYKTGEPGLLSFEFGERRLSRLAGQALAAGSKIKSNLGTLLGRFSWSLPFTLIGMALFVWGMVSYQPYHLTVYRADANQGAAIQDYRVALANKLYRPQRLKLSVQGLPEGSYTLSAQEASFASAGRRDVMLTLHPGLPRGVHRFVVSMESEQGVRVDYRATHVVTGS
ncbi:MAG: 4Fe-4S binding protein [Gammaproteobacteria bacterium]|nr:MAG: 4Fe-4S binding protein [Gammaproteobacteria bacterium]